MINRPALGRTFIREWRQHRGYSLELLAGMIGMSKGNLSQIERGKLPYNQVVLEACAKALNTDAASLIMRDPSQPEALWSIWEHVPPADRPRALSVLEAFTTPDQNR